MNLTDQDLKALEHIEKAYLKMRYLLALYTCFVAGMAIFLGYIIENALHSLREEATQSTLIIAMAFPLLLICALATTFHIFNLTRNWNGNPERKLLIKLVKSSLKQTQNPSQ
jgi:formate/nitrite transporter FocA (FNT family)